ncbi:hypothetical protein ACFX13_025912 [Malus domestica]
MMSYLLFYHSSTSLISTLSPSSSTTSSPLTPPVLPPGSLAPSPPFSPSTSSSHLDTSYTSHSPSITTSPSTWSAQSMNGRPQETAIRGWVLRRRGVCCVHPHHQKRVRPSDGGGEVLVGDGGVVGRELVEGEAERADPDLGSVIDGGEGVEDGAACAVAERGVGEDGHGEEWLDRSVDGWVARWRRRSSGEDEGEGELL